MRFKGVSALHDSLGADFAGVHGTRSEVLQRRGWRFQVEGSLFASAGLKARLASRTANPSAESGDVRLFCAGPHDRQTPSVKLIN